MRTFLRYLATSGLALGAITAYASPTTSAQPTVDPALPSLQHAQPADALSGIVINRTVTVLGRDFYQYFAAAWRDQPDGARYTVSVHERPTAKRGSEMWVQYGQRQVFHAFLSPQRSAARPASRQAAAVALKNVIDIDVARLLFQDTDLGAEEL